MAMTDEESLIEYLLHGQSNRKRSHFRRCIGMRFPIVPM